MTVGLDVNGENNKIVLIKDGKEIPYEPVKGLNITITGNSNTVMVEVPTKFIAVSIVMNGDNNFCHIKEYQFTEI